MNADDTLSSSFEHNRDHLRAVAYRMLGSAAEADDAVQEAWLRLSRADASTVENLGGWLTTVVARVCLDLLRARRARREEPMGVRPPETREHAPDPEQQKLLADSVGPALLVVLETLAPAERIAFVLHDMFGVSFEEIAPIVDRSALAARKLASRARQRVQGAAPVPETDLPRQRQVVEAFLAAARGGDFDALLSLLDPNVTLRADAIAIKLGAPQTLSGAPAVADRFKGSASAAKVAMIDGRPGLAWVQGGTLRALIHFTLAGEKIVEIELLGDPATHAQLQLEL